MQSLKFAFRTIKDNPRPYAAIIAAGAVAQTLVALYTHKKVFDGVKQTLILTDEMWQVLRASEGPIYFDFPEMTLSVRFEY